jgi:GT2 family glycosyltransferase
MSNTDSIESYHPVSIVIPVYGAADQLRTCLESLTANVAYGAEVHLADDATPNESIALVALDFQDRLPGLKYSRNSTNLGFVENCNHAMREVIQTGNDLLLLNSDTKVTPGFLAEMSLVLHHHERHGVVTPRSNNATIFSVPAYERLNPDDAYQLWLSVRDHLPRYHVVPTCVGFCMLIKNIVLQHFGLFDPEYSPGYNEENDFVCRINSCGYSAVSANHAFVFHFESATFGEKRKALEERNREVLNQRYPEYGRKIAQYSRFYIDPIDHFSVLWAPHRKRILYDLSHLPAKHSGTSEFGLSLLAHLAPLLRDHYDLALALSTEAHEFFRSELVGYTFFDERRTPNLTFDLAFKPCQFFKWDELYRLTTRAARLCYTHQDLIAVRCDYICGPNIRSIFLTAAEVADRVITISEASKADFEEFYNVRGNFTVIHHGTAEVTTYGRPSDGYILVVGNEFHHKAIRRAVAELDGCGKVVALGGAPPAEGSASNVEWLSSGELSRAEISEIYEGSSIVVYPSFYEGFGMPILDALAMARPVVVIDTNVNRELKSMIPDPNLHIVPTHRDLRSVVTAILSQPAPAAIPISYRTWQEVAEDYFEALTSLAESPINVQSVRRRWKLLTTIDSICPLV